MNVAEFKEIAGVSRKYAVPPWDSTSRQLTARSGDERKAGRPEPSLPLRFLRPHHHRRRSCTAPGPAGPSWACARTSARDDHRHAAGGAGLQGRNAAPTRPPRSSPWTGLVAQPFPRRQHHVRSRRRRARGTSSPRAREMVVGQVVVASSLLRPISIVPALGALQTSPRLEPRRGRLASPACDRCNRAGVRGAAAARARDARRTPPPSAGGSLPSAASRSRVQSCVVHAAQCRRRPPPAPRPARAAHSSSCASASVAESRGGTCFSPRSALGGAFEVARGVGPRAHARDPARWSDSGWHRRDRAAPRSPPARAPGADRRAMSRPIRGNSPARSASARSPRSASTLRARPRVVALEARGRSRRGARLCASRVIRRCHGGPNPYYHAASAGGGTPPGSGACGPTA